MKAAVIPARSLGTDFENVKMLPADATMSFRSLISRNADSKIMKMTQLERSFHEKN